MRLIKFLVFLMCALLPLCLWQCASPSTAGGVSESGNPVVTGYIKQKNNSPAPNTVVRLIPADYNPVNDSALSDSLIDTTDSQGRFAITSSKKGLFNIEATHIASRERAFTRGLRVIKDTIPVEALTILEPGAIQIFLPDTVDIANGYLYIQGSTIYSNLSSAHYLPSREYLMTIDSVPSSNSIQVYYSEDESLFVPTPISDTIEVMSKDTTTINGFVFWKNYTKENFSLRNNRVTGIFIAPHDDFWFSTLAGVAHYDGKSWDLQFITDNTGIPSNTIHALNRDQKNNFWFATDRGIAQYNGKDPAQTENWKIYNEFLSLIPSNFVSTIQVTNDGYVWVGMHDGIGRFKDSQWKFYDRSNSNLVSYQIHEIAFDSLDKSVWFATDNNIANLRDDSIWTVFNTSNSSILTDVVLSVAVDKSNIKWFGYEGGVSRFNSTDSSWISYDESHSPLLKHRVETIFVGDESNIWFGTTHGVTRFNGTHWIDYAGEKYQFLEGKGILDIAKDSKGNIWIATNNNGIIVFGPNITSYK